MSKIQQGPLCPHCERIMLDSYGGLTCPNEYCTIYESIIHKEYVKGYWVGREEAEYERWEYECGDDL